MSRIVYLMGAGASRGRRKTDNAQYKMEKDESSRHATIDTFAKKLYLRGDKES